nr:hypothetical protein [Candidatus Tectomicrobia bacterium]
MVESVQWLTAHYWYIYGGGCAFMVLLMVIRGLTNRRRIKSSTTHGSARWATPREIRRAGLFAEDGVLLGRYGAKFL